MNNRSLNRPYLIAVRRLSTVLAASLPDINYLPTEFFLLRQINEC